MRDMFQGRRRRAAHP